MELYCSDSSTVTGDNSSFSFSGFGPTTIRFFSPSSPGAKPCTSLFFSFSHTKRAWVKKSEVALLPYSHRPFRQGPGAGSEPAAIFKLLLCVLKTKNWFSAKKTSSEVAPTLISTKEQLMSEAGEYVIVITDQKAPWKPELVWFVVRRIFAQWMPKWTSSGPRKGQHKSVELVVFVCQYSCDVAVYQSYCCCLAMLGKPAVCTMT